MATIGIQNMQVVGTTLGVSTPLMHGKEAASQTYLRFAVLLQKTDGYLETAADDATVISDSAGVVGLATHDATGTTAADVCFEPFLPGVTIIEANLCEDNAGAAHVFAQTDLGVAYKCAVVSGKWILHTTSPGVTTALAIPYMLAGGDGGGIGDTNVRVRAIICQSGLTRYGTAS